MGKKQQEETPAADVLLADLAATQSEREALRVANTELTQALGAFEEAIRPAVVEYRRIHDSFRRGVPTPPATGFFEKLEAMLKLQTEEAQDLTLKGKHEIIALAAHYRRALKDVLEKMIKHPAEHMVRNPLQMADVESEILLKKARIFDAWALAQMEHDRLYDPTGALKQGVLESDVAGATLAIRRAARDAVSLLQILQNENRA